MFAADMLVMGVPGNLFWVLGAAERPATCSNAA